MRTLKQANIYKFTLNFEADKVQELTYNANDTKPSKEFDILWDIKSKLTKEEAAKYSEKVSLPIYTDNSYNMSPEWEQAIKEADSLESTLYGLNNTVIR